MASSYRYSAILLLGDSPVTRAIDQLRHEISRRVGSTAAIELPPHVTILKFSTAGSLEQARLLNVLSAAAPTTIELSGPTVAFSHGALWYSVGSKPLADLQEASVRQISSVDGTKYERQEPHVTLAYEDLTEKELREEYEFAASALPLEDEPVTAARVVLARQDQDGVWAISEI